jgi:hypothetical protein
MLRRRRPWYDDDLCCDVSACTFTALFLVLVVGTLSLQYDIVYPFIANSTSFPPFPCAEALTFRPCDPALSDTTVYTKLDGPPTDWIATSSFVRGASRRIDAENTLSAYTEDAEATTILILTPLCKGRSLLADSEGRLDMDSSVLVFCLAREMSTWFTVGVFFVCVCIFCTCCACVLAAEDL